MLPHYLVRIVGHYRYLALPKMKKKTILAIFLHICSLKCTSDPTDIELQHSTSLQANRNHRRGVTGAPDKGIQQEHFFCNPTAMNYSKRKY